MRPDSPPMYRWQVYDTTSPWKKKGGWRVLTHEMCEADALTWAKANGFDRIEKIPGTEKVYQDFDGR